MKDRLLSFRAKRSGAEESLGRRPVVPGDSPRDVSTPLNMTREEPPAPLNMTREEPPGPLNMTREGPPAPLNMTGEGPPAPLNMTTRTVGSA